MAFSLNVRSVDGFFVGICSPMAAMSGANMLNSPGESTSSLVPLNFGASYWGDAVTEYTSDRKAPIGLCRVFLPIAISATISVNPKVRERII